MAQIRFYVLILSALATCSACSDHPNVASAPSVNQPESSDRVEQMSTDVTRARVADPPASKERKAKNKVKFYHVRGLQAWGDYGDVLVNGYALNDLDRHEDEHLRVSRTGPFMPPITFPGA